MADPSIHKKYSAVWTVEPSNHKKSSVFEWKSSIGKALFNVVDVEFTLIKLQWLILVRSKVWAFINEEINHTNHDSSSFRINSQVLPRNYAPTTTFTKSFLMNLYGRRNEYTFLSPMFDELVGLSTIAFVYLNIVHIDVKGVHSVYHSVSNKKDLVTLSKVFLEGMYSRMTILPESLPTTT